MTRLHKLFALVLAVVAVLPSSTLAAVLGIDFGQASTKAALVSPGVPFEIVLSRDSKRKDVSGIAIKGDERLYGSGAAGLAARTPSSAFLHFKPLLGKSVDSPEAETYLAQHPGVNLVSSGNRSTVSFKTPDSAFPIEELLAMSLSHLKVLAQEMLPRNSPSSRIYEVAITVPPFFTSVQRKAILDAAEIAGLRVVALVPDGVATAINYASSRSFPEKQSHLILDIGAGSTSVSLVSFVEYQEGSSRFGNSALNITVEGVGYDKTLGGDLLDQRIYEILLSRFVAAHGNGIESNPRALVRLHREAERAKTILSANSEVRSSIESLYDDIDFRTTLTRAEFEDAIKDVLPRLAKPFADALAAGGKDISDVQSVILMGGSTRVPILQQVLVDEVLKGDSSKVSKNVNADEAAVMGATFRGVAVSKQFKTKAINVIDPAPHDYDVVLTNKGKAVATQVLFPKGAPVSGNKTTVELAIPTDTDDAVLEFREGGETFLTYGLHGIQDAKAKLLASNNCSELVPVVEAELTISRVFDISAVAWQCNVTLATDDEAEPGDFKQKVFNFFNGAKSSDTKAESEATADTASASATASESEPSAKPKPSSPPKPKIVKQPLKHRTWYPGARNMGRATKATSQTRIRQFDKVDAERHLRDAARNDVESYSYRIREWISNEHERFVEHSTDDERQSFLQKAEAALDWLYEEGESLVLDKLKEKLRELKAFEQTVYEREKAKLKSIEDEILARAATPEADDDMPETSTTTETTVVYTTITTNTDTATYQETPEPRHDEL